MKITVDGVAFPMPDNFTFREMARIKRLTGLRAGELFPALAAGDTDVVFAFAVTAMFRAGQAVDEDKVLDLSIDKIELDLEENETDSPPAVAPAEGAEAAAP